MLTLTFNRAKNEVTGASGKTVISAARYSVIEAGERISVWIYPTQKEETPVLLELHASEDQNTYYELFVTNESGKTIDRHRAYSGPDVEPKK